MLAFGRYIAGPVTVLSPVSSADFPRATPSVRVNVSPAVANVANVPSLASRCVASTTSAFPGTDKVDVIIPSGAAVIVSVPAPGPTCTQLVAVRGEAGDGARFAEQAITVARTTKRMIR